MRLWWLLLFALACSGNKDTDDGPKDEGPPETGDTAAPVVADLDAVLTPSTLVPTVVELTWTTEQAGTSWVEFGIDSPDAHRTPATAEGTAHAVRVVGLKNNQAYQLRAVTELTDGTRLVSEVIAHKTALSPAGLPRLTLTSAEPTATVSGGYVVTTLITSDGGYVVVLDGDADIVWWYGTGSIAEPNRDIPGQFSGWNGHTLPVTSRIDPESGSVVVAFYDGAQTLDVAYVVRIPLDAMSADDVVWTRTNSAHHDFVVHAGEQRTAWLGYEFQTVGPDLWAADAIFEAPEGADEATPFDRIWSWHDDFPDDPWVLHDLQTNFAGPYAQYEWTHSNSLMFDEASDSYFVMSKFLDALVKVDRSTGTHEWVMGGFYSDFTLPGGGPVWTSVFDTELWSHAHMSHLWYDAASGTGGLVVFDNGYNYPDIQGTGLGWSRVAELTFDENARTVEKVWEMIEPNGAFTPLMGDARKLDGGTYLVGWSSLGRIDELDAAGTVLWRAETGIGSITGRTSWYDEIHPALLR